MASRRFRLACALVCTPLVGVATGAAAGPSAPPATPSGLPAYRAYASSQAEMLARMTRVLARDVASGDLAAAQNDYAMAHKYLERIKPVSAKLNRDLDKHMDASVEGDPKMAPDPSISGFHRLEHDLFASRSTDGLAPYADRLHDDAVELHAVIESQAMPADALVEGAIGMLETASSRTPGAGLEPYSRTDLWDIEANLEGAREIVAAIRPQIEGRDPLLMARIASALATADARVATYQAGCGFKSFDELTDADKASLRDATAALARELSKIRAVPAVD